MRTIASVAIEALDKFKAELQSAEGYYKYRPLWLGWREVRKINGGTITSPYYLDWRDKVVNIVDSMKENYSKGDKFHRRMRWYWLETYNMRVEISVMGGYKDENAKEWEPECKVVVCQH